MVHDLRDCLKSALENEGVRLGKSGRKIESVISKMFKIKNYNTLLGLAKGTEIERLMVELNRHKGILEKVTAKMEILPELDDKEILPRAKIAYFRFKSDLGWIMQLPPDHQRIVTPENYFSTKARCVNFSSAYNEKRIALLSPLDSVFAKLRDGETITMGDICDKDIFLKKVVESAYYHLVDISLLAEPLNQACRLHNRALLE